VVEGWREVASIVRESFEVVIEGDDWVGLLHEQVKVKVSELEALGRRFVAITADVFEKGAVTMDIALALNHVLPIGALELENDRYLLRATLPMVGLDPVDLRRVILHVGRQAAHMRHRRARNEPLEAFHHWTD
jgi:hypothetical protein